MIRGKTGLSAVVIILFAVMCGSTAAYCIDTDRAENIFPVGSQVSEISSSRHTGDKAVWSDGVAVVNTGTVDCYVRLLIECADGGSTFAEALNEADWTGKQTDGYYYYREPLHPGERTVPLLDKSAADLLRDADLVVYEETVQAAGSDDPVTAFND